MFTLRDYSPADFKRLWQLDQICFVRGIAYSQSELKQFLDLRVSFTIVGEDNAQIAGFVLAVINPKTGHIVTIDVHPDARRSGLGSLLMEAAEKRIYERGIPSVALEVAVDNMAAIKFYQRHGYMVLKTIPRYYNNTLDALRMGKQLLQRT